MGVYWADGSALLYSAPMTTIREYRKSDLPALLKLIGELHDALRRFDEYLAPVEQIAERYAAYLFDTCRRSSGTFLVAVQDDRLVGFVCVFGLVPPDEPDQYPDEFAAIANIYYLRIAVVARSRHRGRPDAAGREPRAAFGGRQDRANRALRKSRSHRFLYASRVSRAIPNFHKKAVSAPVRACARGPRFGLVYPSRTPLNSVVPIIVSYSPLSVSPSTVARNATEN